MDGHTIKTLNVFYCCADEDLQTLNKLDKQLNVLKNRGWIQCWHESKILPGTERDREVKKQLNAADIILFFVSADFLSSPRCDLQMQIALERYKGKQATLIPLLIRPADWQNSPLGKFHILPENGIPVTLCNNLDEVLYNIANGIQLIVKTLLKGVYLASVAAESSFADRLQQDLEDRGIIVWSVPKEQSIDREKTVQQMILVARIVVLIASPSTKYDRSIQEELRTAHMYQKLIAPLWVAGNTWQEAAPRQLDQSSYFDGRTPEDYENALGRILALYNRVGNISPPPPPAPLPKPRNPYKALRAFTSSDEDIHDFFGREKLTSELVEAIREILTIKNKDQSERFLAVIGPSGVGKSSVVMAGLLPCLQRGALSGSENWVYLTMIPGKSPVESLALVLAKERPGESAVKAILDELDVKGAHGLYWQASKLMKSPGTKIVLVVDQFEELFTQPSEQERQHFIDLLVAAATEPQSPVIVIVTLRADFYDRLMNNLELRRKLIETPSKKNHSRFVPPMDIDELRAVIEKPAALPDVQLSFDEDLVGDLLFETRGQAGALPLLEFTLDQLFQRRRDQQLTRQAYEEIGGVKGALKNQAESTVAALPSEEHRQLARVLFLRLIDPGTTEQDTTRRRAALTELTLPDPEQTRLLRSVADAFIDARLLTTNEIGGSATIELSHEALIREWPQLRDDWLPKAREDILLHQSLNKDVREWKQRKEKRKPSRDLLYRGNKLKEAREWAERNTPSKQEAAFLRASTTQRNLSLLGLILTVLLLISSAGVAGWFALMRPADPKVVTTLQDSVSGSLRYCIDNAPSGSTIRFAQGMRGIIELTGGRLTVAGDKNLTITGPGAALLTINGDDMDSGIDITRGSTLTVSGLSFKNASNIVIGFFYNEEGGTLTIANSTIANNKTDASNTIALGGSIYNRGTLTVTGSTIEDNMATASAQSGPDSKGQGGGIDNEGRLTVIDSTFTNNQANGAQGFGGAIANSLGGTLTVRNSTFSGNSASSSGSPNFSQDGISQGGAIDNDQGSRLTVIDSTFTNNSANGTKNGSGGGIVNFSKSILTVTGSTFSGNSASGKESSYGGGIYNGGQIIVSNSTLAYNKAIGNKGYGGGILSGANGASPSATISFCTIYGNSSYTGGGIWLEAGSRMQLSRSIVANNSATDFPDIFQANAGVLTSGGYNLIQNIVEVNGLDFTTDRQVALSDLKINPTLGNNGGLTQTLALLQGSPAIDVVPAEACSIAILDASDHPVTITTDQRGDRRPDGSEKMCDTGAYESSY